jgi:hypothetical protein
MLMGFIAACMVASVPLTGGSLRRLARQSFTALWLLPSALLLQVLVINIFPTAPAPIPAAAHLLTYALATVFIIRNRRIRGIPTLAIGAAMNGIAIAANGGTLPASQDALREAGWNTTDAEFANSAVLHAPRLGWLGDNFAIPANVPFANVFSIGDIVILLGALILLHRGSRDTTDNERSPQCDGYVPT